MNTAIVLPDIGEMDATQIKQELADNGVKLHHLTGLPKLAETLLAVREGEYETPAPAEAKTEIKAPDKDTGPTEEATKAMLAATTLTKTQKAMALRRIIVTPNDPLMSTRHGHIFCAGSSSVNNGKMVKKFVPFGNEEGWHVPQIIYDQIKYAEMRKEKPHTDAKGNSTMVQYIAKKYNIQDLPPLTQEEMNELAASQRAKSGMQV